MKTHRVWVHCFRLVTGAICVLAGICPGINSFADSSSTLAVKLTPTIVITAPPGSLQQVEYSTNIADPKGWNILAQVRMDTNPKPFFDTAATGPQRFYRTETIGVSDTNLLLILPGTSLMGSTNTEEGRSANEGPQTLVTFTNYFLMGRYQIKNWEFIATLGHYPTNSPDYDRGALTNRLQFPARNVTWSDAVNYCSQRTSFEQAHGMIPPGWTYRLPTEAEREYACRAGTTTPFAIGPGTELRNDAVRQDAAFDGTHPYPSSVTPIGPIDYPAPVLGGTFAPNAFGLYDVHGNVQEWSWDDLGSALPGGSVTNVVGNIGSLAALRGGSFLQQGVKCRSAFRLRTSALTTATDAGFRVVLIPGSP